jgi:hypothetical protein
MKTTLLLRSLSFVLCAACAVAQFPPAGSQTEYPLTNFPSAFLTNRAGMHWLKPPWVGETRPVVLTGLFSTDKNSPEIEKKERELRFDLLFLQDSRLGPFGEIQISECISAGSLTNPWVYSMLHDYRPALPSNATIQACSTEADLRKLLGDPRRGELERFSATGVFSHVLIPTRLRRFRCLSSLRIRIGRLTDYRYVEVL